MKTKHKQLEKIKKLSDKYLTRLHHEIGWLLLCDDIDYHEASEISFLMDRLDAYEDKLDNIQLK
jgi:hypothetical protein